MALGCCTIFIVVAAVVVTRRKKTIDTERTKRTSLSSRLSNSGIAMATVTSVRNNPGAGSIAGVNGSMFDEDGNALPAGWRRHFAEEEGLPYFTDAEVRERSLARGRAPRRVRTRTRAQLAHRPLSSLRLSRVSPSPSTSDRPSPARSPSCAPPQGSAHRTTWTKPQAALFEVIRDAPTGEAKTDWSSVRRGSVTTSWGSLTEAGQGAREGSAAVAQPGWTSARDSVSGHLFFTDPATGRSSWNVPMQEEFRVDRDGLAYSKAQFVAHYGGHAEWDAAKRIRSEREMKRMSANARSAAPPNPLRASGRDVAIQEGEEEEEETEDEDVWQRAAGTGAIGAASRPGGRRRANKGGRAKTFVKPRRPVSVQNVVIGGALRQSLARFVSPMRASVAERTFAVELDSSESLETVRTTDSPMRTSAALAASGGNKKTKEEGRPSEGASAAHRFGQL